MSEIRLVRCPKCDKVLPEPPVFTVYQCGGCGAMLRADKKSSESEKLVNSDKGFNRGKGGGEEIKDSSESREVDGVVLQEGNSDMANKSPLRSTIGDGSGIKSTLEESDLNEFHGGFPKSPMRDRFLNDLSSSPMRSRNVSPSPMRSRNVSPSPMRSRNVSPSPIKSRNVSPSPMRGRGSGDFDFDGGGQSPARPRELSMSPLREQRGDRSPMSVRTRNYSRSPMREVNGANMANSLPREDDVSGFDESAEKEEKGTWGDFDEAEKEEKREKMTPKTSFNVWLSDEKSAQESNDHGLGRRKKKWKDTVYDDADRISEGKESGYENEHGMTSEGSVDDLTYGDLRSRSENVRGYRKAKANVDQQFIESDGDGMIYTNSIVAAQRRRNSVSSSVDGSSSYRPESISSYGHPRRSYESPRGPSDVHYMERVERSQNYKAAGNYSEEEHLRFRKRYMQQYSPDKLMPRSSYYDHGPGLVHEMEAYDHHSLYEDPYAGPMGSEHFPREPQFSRHAMTGGYRGQSLDFDQDSFRSYNNGEYRHYPADYQGHYPPPRSFGSRISTNIPVHQSSSRSMDLQRPGPRTYDPRMSHTAPRERQSHLAPHRHRNFLVASQDKRLCLPIAGGSPFLLCHSCYELLKLPANFMKKQKNECTLRCGACSLAISFDLRNLSSVKKQDTTSAASGPGEVLNEPGRRHQQHHHHESFAATSTTVESYEFDEGRNSLQSMESEPNESSRGRKLASDYDVGVRGFSPSPLASKEEPIVDNVLVQSSLSSSSEMPSKIRPPPGSPLLEHLDYSSQFHKAELECVVNHYEEEKQERKRDTSPKSSLAGLADTTVASETEIDSHGLSNSLSDSGDLPREDNNKDKQRPNYPFWKSPFASRSGHASPIKGEVFVNGQQVPHHLVKKAEQLAGPIKPGDYWYDPKAGFWGVMGHHGLGIIPPSIPEFSFPMPESCSGGNTAVYVNGRELHKSDLDLLVTRGFPSKSNKRYIIDMSGEVIEEQNKEIVVRIGKLAPTVEKYKRGFGMRVPDKFKN